MGQIDVNIGDTHIMGGYDTKKVGPTLFVDCSVLAVKPVNYIETTIVLNRDEFKAL